MKYQFIAKYQQTYPVKTLCRILEVSVSGYYAWRSRPQSRRKQEDALIAEQVRRVFTANRGVRGFMLI
jgi:putative transposase